MRDRFEALFAECGREVLAFAVRRTDQPADAADVVAETFLVAWRRLDVVPPGDEARLWLYGVARQVMANTRRGERRRARLGERLATAVGEHVVADHAEVVGTVTAVRAALADLPTDDRELLQLTVWEGLTSAQAAVVLGIPAGTVRSRLHTLRGRLRTAIEHNRPTGHEAVDERVLVRDREDRP
ncbi:MAG TPA: RNA polymerase sigma factor [Acidimicrobiales bacterium]|nr:RNA polymerase sigma factor [Acidimicrobiales bacterium]